MPTAPPYPNQVIFITLTGQDHLRDFNILISSGTVVSGPRAEVYGVASRDQLRFLTEQGVDFKEIGPGKRV